jgi:hypothetical protein
MHKQLIANKWQCPDGTILHSKTGWDFVEHNDKSGETAGTVTPGY